MQTSQFSPFLERVAARWNNSWLTERVEFDGGILGACRHEQVRPKIAAIALVALLLSQTMIPGALLLSSAHAGELQQKQALQAQARAREAQTPAWAKAVEARIAQQKQANALRLTGFDSPSRVTAASNVVNRPPLVGVASSKAGQIKPSQELDCADCDVDPRALDLSHVPTEKELRRAGQLGGALTPLRPADPDDLGIELDKLVKRAGLEAGLGAQVPPKDPRARGLKRAKEKLARAQAINLDFGKAMQEWNSHHYDKAAQMLEKHVKDYPESPWLGEAQLHIGCDHKYNGRFAEAQDVYSDLLKNTSDKPNKKLKKERKERKLHNDAPDVAALDADVADAAQSSGSLDEAVVKLDAPTEENDESFELHQKAKQRWADLDIATGRWNAAADKLADILKTETDWRRITWAQHWLRNLSTYKRNERQLRACGPKALGAVLASLGKTQAAEQLKHTVALSNDGSDLGQLQQLAAHYGARMEGFRGTPATLEQMPLPLILHYDFGADPEHPNTKVVSDDNNAFPGAHRAGAQTSPFRIAHRRGHFVVARKVDAAAKRVTIFDPQEGRTFGLSYTQLGREWSGQGLALATAATSKGKPAAIRLSVREMKKAVGGCCGLPSVPDDIGPTNHNTVCKECEAAAAKARAGAGLSTIYDRGEPSVSFNELNMNMFVHDTPLWYDAPKGPSVGISVSYNSQDATTQNSAFGNKWSFNYGSYLVEDTAAGGGRITVFMGDGRQINYTPDGSGGFNTEVDVHDTLVKVNATRYELHLQGGGEFIYDIPAGTNSQQSFLIAQVDPWGQALTFGYDSQVHLTTITDALGRVTSLRYDAGGHVTSVWDPFGRHASFLYDTNGNLIQAVDMEGQAFGYTYDSLVRMTQLNTAMGPWQFTHEGPDGDSSASDTYTAPGGPMWASDRITVQAPNGGKEEYMYYAGWGYETDGMSDERSWHVDQNHYVEYTPNHNNASSDVAKTQWDTDAGMSSQGQLIGGKGKVRIISNAAGEKNYLDYDPNTGNPNVITDARGQTSHATYNAQGMVTSSTDPKGHVTTLTYAANGLDVTGVTNANGVQVISATYNNVHQPLSVTDVSGTTTFTYTSWGAPYESYDPQGRGSRTLYDNLGQVSQVQFSDAPNGGARVWETMGGFTYDEVGRVKTVSDATGLTVGYDYNNLDNVTKVSYPDGTSETTEYTCCGIPGVETDRAGRKSYFDYDVMKRLTRVQDAAGNTLQMDRDANGNLLRLVDAKGHLTKWQYDAVDRVIAKAYNDGTTEDYAYSQGLLSQSKGARGQVVNYSYDANANLTLIDYPNMSDVSMSYDNLDDVTQIVDGVGTHSFTYDNQGKLLSLDGPFADDEQTFTYDALQRLQTQTVGRGASGGTQSQSYAYDALGRLSSLTSNGTQGVGAFNYSYVGLTDMLQSLQMPNGTQTVQSYDGLQRLTQVVNQKNNGTNLNKFAYAYDNRDVRTGVQQQYGTDPLRQVNYAYDSVDQLVGEAATGGVAGSNYTNAFSYDAMGNRLKLDSVAGTDTSSTHSSVNALNQLTSVSSTVNNGAPVTTGLSYDVAGNLTDATNADGSHTLYNYDDADRLFRAERRNVTGASVSKSEFVYDYASRKAISREYSWTNGAWVQTGEKRRVFDGLDVVQERNAQNEVTAQLVRDGNVGGILARSTSVGASFFGYDGGGNVTLLTDANGNDVGRYRYDAFGNTLEASGVRASENPYRFSTKEYDGATGLYDFGLRFYSTSMGRWINRDPIQEDGGINVYGMVGNDPVNRSDSYGLYATVRIYGDEVRIFIPMKYSGDAAYPHVISDYNKSIEKMWTGKFGRYHVKTFVVTPKPGVPYNKIDIPISSDEPAHCSSDHNSGVWPMLDTPDWGVAHEAGHLMGLEDRYWKNSWGQRFGQRRYTVPNKGWEGNIMAQFNGRVEERNITDILRSKGLIPQPQLPFPSSGAVGKILIL